MRTMERGDLLDHYDRLGRELQREGISQDRTW